MTRFLFLIVASFGLSVPASVAAQNNAAPANVVTPAPTPREGTVGPEQLRDFALPGTRQGSAPAPEQTRPAPVAAPTPRVTTPPAATTRPAPSVPAQAEPAPSGRTAVPTPERNQATPVSPRADERQAAPIASPPPPLPSAGESASPTQAAPPLPPITVTQSGSQAGSSLPGWWPWILVAVLAGVGLALFRRGRRRPALAGHVDEGLEPEVAAPPLRRATVGQAVPTPSPSPSPPSPAPPPPAPELPRGVVTTRLRRPEAPPAMAPEAAAAPPPVSGGIVSRRLRGWIDIDLVVREILFDGAAALFRVDLIIANGGTAPARDISLEALTLNGGATQAADLEGFFARPAASVAAVPELGALSDIVISHELRMPRDAIRAYDMQGRTLFVPLLAVNASYRAGAEAGRTSAAFLVGRDVAGAEKLAPLLLPVGEGRALGLGVRRLDEAVRR